MKKQCFKCGRILDIEEFYPHKQMRDGHLNKCKECTKKDASKRLRLHPDVVKEYESKRSKTEHRKKLRLFYTEKYRKEHPERISANSKVGRAIKSGKIIKPKCCSICGKECKTVAHHYDYSKPLDVIFVCQSCHKRIHAGTL